MSTLSLSLPRFPGLPLTHPALLCTLTPCPNPPWPSNLQQKNASKSEPPIASLTIPCHSRRCLTMSRPSWASGAFPSVHPTSEIKYMQSRPHPLMSWASRPSCRPPCSPGTIPFNVRPCTGHPQTPWPCYLLENQVYSDSWVTCPSLCSPVLNPSPPIPLKLNWRKCISRCSSPGIIPQARPCPVLPGSPSTSENQLDSMYVIPDLGLPSLSSCTTPPPVLAI